MDPPKNSTPEPEIRKRTPQRVFFVHFSCSSACFFRASNLSLLFSCISRALQPAFACISRVPLFVHLLCNFELLFVVPVTAIIGCRSDRSKTQWDYGDQVWRQKPWNAHLSVKLQNWTCPFTEPSFSSLATHFAGFCGLLSSPPLLSSTLSYSSLPYSTLFVSALLFSSLFYSTLLSCFFSVLCIKSPQHGSFFTKIP